MKLSKVFKDGIFANNPVFIQLIGLCSVLGVSSTVLNSIAMGLALTFVLVGSNLVISLLRNVIPDKIRIPCYIVIIATFVTVVDMSIHAISEDIYAQPGIFIPLIVVNCIVLARAESFANKNGVGASLVDGIGNGLGYLLAISITGFVREFLGSGSILGMQIYGDVIQPIKFFAQPAGAFVVLGILMAAFRVIMKKKA